MIKRAFTLFLFSLILNHCLFAQPKCYFEHYGTDDGLPQHTIMDILQDKKGFMWFSTWDGLCKFDGYTFYTYKIQQGDLYHMRSNRIDFICEDKYGNIWALPYDREPHRFDPRTEKFMGLRSLPEYKDFTFTATKIIPTESGRVWLLSDNMGCVSVVDSTFNVELYNTDNQKIGGNKVYTIHEDKDKNTWILTNNGLFRLSADGKTITNMLQEKGGRKKDAMTNFYSVEESEKEIWFGANNGQVCIYNKQNNQLDFMQMQTSSGIGHIKKINDNELLLATQTDGFFVYNKSSKEARKYDTVTLNGMANNQIISCYIDKSNNVWLELNDLGVSKFNPYTREMKHYELKIESAIMNVFPPNFFIFEDNANRLWVHPRGGGFAYYNPSKDILEPFYNEPYSKSWQFSNMMHTAYSDRQGDLWLSTRSHGLEKVIFNNEVFKSTIVDPNINSTINNDIRALAQDEDQNLWVSTKGGKVFIYDKQNREQGYLCKDGSVGVGEPLAGITYTILQDNDNNVWLGTKGEGIYKLTPVSGKFAFHITHYKNSASNLYSLSDNSIYSIFQDIKGRIWIGTYGGGLNLFEDKDGGRFINAKNDLKGYPIEFGSQIRVVSSDKYGNICVGTTLGLIMFSSDFSSPNTIEYKSYMRIPEGNESISANDIYDICTTKSGETYIGTFGGGINKVESVDDKGFPTHFIYYTAQNGLPSDVILTIVEDDNGKLWVATEGNLTKFDTKELSFETYSDVKRLIGGWNFSEGARLNTADGIVLFGYSKGFISINPNKVQYNHFKPYVALTRFQINNKDVPIGQDSPLKENIDDVRKLELRYDQNFINIEFAALDYVDSKRIYYAYKLDGFDKDWVITNKQRFANYTNLSPGEYTFRVKSTNSDGVWMDNEHILQIEIIPSFWQTGWAYALYIIVSVLVIMIVFRTVFMFYRLKDKMNLEHENVEMKIRFFTDVSHEIRTPLTMIVSPLENIIEDEKTPDAVKSQLHLVLKNANRMLRMVNQILDFRKIQKQKLNIQEIPIGVYTVDICSNFAKTAEAQGIKFEVNNQVGNQTVWLDRESLEKLVFNLLSNAIKYTPEGKAIEVNVFDVKKENAIAIEVEDEGRGMTKVVQNKLFTRFASFNKDQSKPSTGIGLSIVKEVAEKHHAKILVDSSEGEGSSFTVLFPLGLDHFKNDHDLTYAQTEAGTPTIENGERLEKEVELVREEIILSEEADQRSTILVTEDDVDLRKFIVSILVPHYTILEANNGKEGFEIASKELPDFIISDIMMPEVDGVEFLQKIRNNNTTSHIPFILLTAKTDLESKLEGLEYGADDYITKPFSVRFLKARIENIMGQRKRLYEDYTRGVKAVTGINNRDEKTADAEKKEPSSSSITPQDEAFIKKIKEEIEKNIDDSDFLVDDLASAMAMSRTVFFKKLKSLTGMSPIEFIRDIKIKYAGNLLLTQQYTVKEVSFMIGISDTKYFTQCFKRVYNMTPSEYKTKGVNNY